MSDQEQSAEVYDFIHPDHKLCVRWPVLEQIHQQLVSIVAERISERLKISVTGSSAEVTSIKISDAVETTDDTALIYELRLRPLSGNAWISMDISLVSAFVEKYFGGTGAVGAEVELRKLSPTEMRMSSYVCDAIKSSLEEVWSSVQQVSSDIGTQISRSQMARQEDVAVVIEARLNFNLGEEVVTMKIHYPYSMLEPIGVFLRQEFSPTESQDNQFSSALRRELLNCDIELRGVMAETRLSIGKILALKAGDFIPLRDIENVSFKANQIPLFDAQLGVSNGRVSASFSHWRSET